MSMKGVNKAMATAKSVAKKSTKVFIAALPILSVAGNVLVAAQGTQDPVLITRRLVRAYSGFDFVTGDWSGMYAARGAGTLIGTAIVSKVLSALV